jgi:hypothetical protein
MPDNVSDSAYTTRPLTADTWDDFAKLVEANNGVWGGCWCMGFHPEGVGKEHTASQNRDAKQAHVRQGTVHQVLVYDGQDCVGWCQYGSPPQGLQRRADRSTGLADRLHLHGQESPPQGVARAAVTAVLAAIEEAGGGLVEAYPEQVEGRERQRGAYFHTGTENLFEELGFERDRRIAKWRWVMRRHIPGVVGRVASDHAADLAS